MVQWQYIVCKMLKQHTSTYIPSRKFWAEKRTELDTDLIKCRGDHRLYCEI